MPLTLFRYLRVPEAGDCPARRGFGAIAETTMTTAVNPPAHIDTHFIS